MSVEHSYIHMVLSTTQSMHYILQHMNYIKKLHWRQIEMTQTFFFMIMTALVISNYLQVPVCLNYKAFTNTYLVFIVK